MLNIRGLYQITKNAVNKKNLILGSRYFFAKEPKQPKDSGKKDEKASVPQVIPEASFESVIFPWIVPNHSSLSAKQLKYLDQNFDDLSQSDKQILDKLADILLQLKSATFYDAVLKKGVLGTCELHYVGVQTLQQEQMRQNILNLKKQA